MALKQNAQLIYWELKKQEGENILLHQPLSGEERGKNGAANTSYISLRVRSRIITAIAQLEIVSYAAVPPCE